jgi:hypothetical protein
VDFDDAESLRSAIALDGTVYMNIIFEIKKNMYFSVLMIDQYELM